MAMILFELASGIGGVAVDEEEISALWAGLEPGTTAIERMGGETIVVAGEYDKITADLFKHADLRPKKKKKRTASKQKKTRGPMATLIVLEAFRRKQP